MANKNKPLSITTKRYSRNLIISAIILIAIISVIGFAFATSAMNNRMAEPSAIPFVTSAVDTNTTPTITEIQEETDALNTPQEACSIIAGYYKALASKDVKALKDLGAYSAANALSRNWLEDIDYKIDYMKLAKPDANAFPISQGLYAGCTLYRISDFYSKAPEKVIHSKVCGDKGAEGWIYYDPINVRWVIADPTIPSAFASPTAATIERLSSDKKATVKITCNGVYANSWWAWANCEIQLLDNSQQTPIEISPAKFDNGFTVALSEHIKNGAHAAIADSRSEVKGTCAMWRGSTTEYGIEKIGAKALEVDGNICPIIATYGNEDISPIFTVGKTDFTELADELAAAQIENYGAEEIQIPEPAQQ